MESESQQSITPTATEEEAQRSLVMPVASEAGLTDAFDEAWSTLVSRWDDPGAHKTFVFLANTLDRLPDAAARYKTMRTSGEERPAVGYRVPADLANRAAMAELGMKLITQQAFLKFAVIPREKRPRRGWILMPISAFGMLVALGFLTAQVTGRRWFVSVPMIVLYAAATVMFPWKRLREAYEHRAG